jgi:hypothetical protein
VDKLLYNFETGEIFDINLKSMKWIIITDNYREDTSLMFKMEKTKELYYKKYCNSDNQIIISDNKLIRKLLVKPIKENE